MKIALYRSLSGHYTTVSDATLAAMVGPDYVRISEWVDVTFVPRTDLQLPEGRDVIRLHEMVDEIQQRHECSVCRRVHGPEVTHAAE